MIFGHILGIGHCAVSKKYLQVTVKITVTHNRRH